MNQDGPQCIFCNTPASLHHRQGKGMGGTQDPERLADTVPLCERCHIPTLHDQPYVLERTIEGQVTIYRMVSPGGEIIAERRYLEGFGPEQEGDLIWRLERLMLAEEAERVYYMSHEGIVALAGHVRELGRRGWLFQAHLANAAYSRMPWGSKEEKRKAVCSALGISTTKFFELVNTVRAFPDISGRTETSQLTPTHYALAARADDPQAAVEMAEERLAEDGHYPTRQMAQDLGLRHGDCPWWDEEAGKCLRYGKEA